MFEASSVASRYTCQVPGQPVTIHLNLDVIDWLGADVGTSLERSGLLLGRMEAGEGITNLFVDDCEPVASGGGDRKLLQEKIAQRSSGGDCGVVGFYRSLARPDVSLADDDISLMKECFRDPQVFLLIKPTPNAPTVGGFFTWEDGQFEGKSAHQFVFERSELTPPALPAEADSRPVMENLAREMARNLESKRGLRWLGIAAAAALAITALALFLQRSPRTPPPSVAPVPLALNVSKDGERLRLGWDRNATAVREGQRAVLWIADGQRQQRLDLDSTQLTSGSVIYWPAGSDVNFRLEVFAPKGSMMESVRVVGIPAALATHPPAPVAVIPKPAPPEKTRPRAQNKDVAKPPSPVAEVTKPSPFGVPPKPQVETAQPSFTPPPATPARVAQAPPLPFPDVRAPAPSATFSTVTVEPVRDSRFGRVIGKIPLLRRVRKRPDYVPPKALHQASPVVPPELRDSLREPVPVDVRVYVDETGKVEYAEVLDRRSRGDQRLESLAVYASRRWQFAPAREGEQTVPAEVILHYRFGEPERR